VPFGSPRFTGRDWSRLRLGRGRRLRVPSAATRLRKALAKHTKDELIDVLVEFATDNRDILRRLVVRFELEASPKELVVATRRTITDATDFDDRDINRTFSYDDEAYSKVTRNLSRLIDLGQLGPAMELSLELMKAGSHQVEMSDDGLMAEDIEECLRVVIKTLKKSDLRQGERIACCEEMRHRDCVGFILRSRPSNATRPLRVVAIVIPRGRSSQCTWRVRKRRRRRSARRLLIPSDWRPPRRSSAVPSVAIAPSRAANRVYTPAGRTR